MRANKISIPTAIICDDVRREDNGKEILIGVYTGDMIFAQLPGTMRACIWLPWWGKTSAKRTEKFWWRISDQGKPLIEGAFDIDTKGVEGSGTVGIGNLTLRFDEPTIMTIEVKRGTDSWKMLRQIKVRATS